MPEDASNKIFRYYINKQEPKPYFEGFLHKQQCAYTSPLTHKRCTRLVVLGLPYCSQHLQIEMHLKIKKSKIENAGYGVYATIPKGNKNDVVFKKGDKICYYTGELLNENQIDKRYGEDFTAPYAMELKTTNRLKNKRINMYIDCALHRCVASLINHSTYERSNVKFVQVQNENKIEIIAKENIKNGKELLGYYGTAYKFNEPTHYSTRNINKGDTSNNIGEHQQKENEN